MAPTPPSSNPSPAPTSPAESVSVPSIICRLAETAAPMLMMFVWCVGERGPRSARGVSRLTENKKSKDDLRLPIDDNLLTQVNCGGIFSFEALKICLEEMYRQVGSQFREELQRQHFPSSMVVAYDFGIKHNILRCLASYGCKITLVPSTWPSAEALKVKPDGIRLFFDLGELPWHIQCLLWKDRMSFTNKQFRHFLGSGNANGPGIQALMQAIEHELEVTLHCECMSDTPQTMSPSARNSRIVALENMLATSSSSLVSMASQLSEAEERERVFGGRGRWNQVRSIVEAKNLMNHLFNLASSSR
ncbi:uncharacterized protein A4U43_C07F15090 [Asparagus officinalis]|uniref:Uncharacterized protein n=1 Tax=Asparagus officinalis TaxID=4686 RepID=A0A5P1EC58_ASPOF|nr:uncharacterized protein A4U43_C07F15090 [Asparagus officinalis]